MRILIGNLLRRWDEWTRVDQPMAEQFRAMLKNEEEKEEKASRGGWPVIRRPTRATAATDEAS